MTTVSTTAASSHHTAPRIIPRELNLSEGRKVIVWVDQANDTPTVMGVYKPDTVPGCGVTHAVDRTIWHHNFITGETDGATDEGVELLRDAVLQLLAISPSQPR